MKIRTVTLCADLGDEGNRKLAGDFSRDALDSMPCEVETVRVSTVPLNPFSSTGPEIVEKAVELDGWALDSGIDYVGGFGLGSYPCAGDLGFIDHVPEIIASTERIFSHCQLAWGKKVSVDAVKRTAAAVSELSSIDGGFANLRFAGLYNCASDNPFYPASYCGDERCFTVGISAADLALQAFSGASTLLEARENLIGIIRDRYCELLSACIGLEQVHNVFFKGIDFTLAPSAAVEGSIANALEQLGGFQFGQSATLFFSAMLSDTLKSLGGGVGFNGLMYPVLEDPVIARRASEGALSVESLLMYSAVCGTGLDCIPLPGDVGEQTLGALMLDVAGLSIRLGKPLITRLMPVPGKKAGDMTEFDFPYFVNTRVMEAKKGSVDAIRDSEFTFLV